MKEPSQKLGGKEGFYKQLHVCLTVEGTKVSSGPTSYYQSGIPAPIGT